jgi:hypothetical protein
LYLLHRFKVDDFCYPTLQMPSFNGQAQQDKFVLHALGFKRGGTFLEIGANHPIKINNTYTLEHDYDWRGIMVEYDSKWLPYYKNHRSESIHVIQDATTIDYKQLLDRTGLPTTIDYLQIDLEVENRSTLSVLEKLDAEVFDTYTFSTVTFEHDIYRGNFFDTRMISRDIFERRGYVRVFGDISNEEAKYVYEDWYVHPNHVNMEYISALENLNKKTYETSPITGSSICWNNIVYP